MYKFEDLNWRLRFRIRRNRFKRDKSLFGSHLHFYFAFYQVLGWILRLKSVLLVGRINHSACRGQNEDIRVNKVGFENCDLSGTRMIEDNEYLVVLSAGCLPKRLCLFMEKWTTVKFHYARKVFCRTEASRFFSEIKWNSYSCRTACEV